MRRRPGIPRLSDAPVLRLGADAAAQAPRLEAWLKEGMKMRRQQDKAGRRVRNLVESAMRAGN